MYNNEFYLYLIRHAESEVNATPDIIGQKPDVLLTEKGKLQAQQLNKRLSDLQIDHVYSSSYLRAKETAKIAVYPNYTGKIKLAPALREYSAGDWLGKSRAEIFSPEIKKSMDYMNHGFKPPNGESLNEVQRRSTQWLEENIIYNKELIEESLNFKDVDQYPANILIFSHGMTIKSILHYVMGFNQNLTWKISINNTSVTKLHFGSEGWRVKYINDYSHLKCDL